MVYIGTLDQEKASMHTTEQAGTSSDREKYELLIVPEGEVWEHRDDFARLFDGKKIRVPILYSIDQAIEMVEKGRMQLWLFRIIGEDYPCLAMLTEIVEYPAGRTVHVCLTIGSDMHKLAKRFLPLFLAWCKQRHADYIETTTHPSIARMLIRFGFTPTGVRVHYPLNIQ